jgi:hypothetical protein
MASFEDVKRLREKWQRASEEVQHWEKMCKGPAGDRVVTSEMIQTRERKKEEREAIWDEYTKAEDEWMASLKPGDLSDEKDPGHEKRLQLALRFGKGLSRPMWGAPLGKRLISKPRPRGSPHRVRPSLLHRDTSVRQFGERAMPKRDLDQDFAGITGFSVWTEPGLDSMGQRTDSKIPQKQPEESVVSLSERLEAVKDEPSNRDLLFAEFMRTSEGAAWIDDPVAADAAYNEYVESLNGDELRVLVGRLRGERYPISKEVPAEAGAPHGFLEQPLGAPAVTNMGPMAPVQPVEQPLMPLALLAEPPVPPPLTGTETPINDSQQV